MLSIFLLSVLAFAGVQAQLFPCNKFWPLGSQYTLNNQCYLYSGYFGGFPVNPQLIYDVQVTLAVEGSLQTNPGFVDTAAKQIQQALIDTVWQYKENLNDVFSDIVIILTDPADPTPAFKEHTATTIRPAWPVGACQIVLYTRWASLDDNGRRQALAHELYHCVQQTMISADAAADSASEWWVEGSAAYFSNVVYDTYNLEWRQNPYDENQPSSLQPYFPDQPIYGQTDDYSVEIFFQAMANGLGSSYVNGWVLTQTYTSSFKLERARFSKLTDFPDYLHAFAQLFSLNNIYDTDGELIPIVNPIVPAYPTPVTTSATDGNLPLTVDTFTLNEFVFSLGPAQTVMISHNSPSNANVRVSYKLYTDTVWTTMIDSPSGGATGSITIPCNFGHPENISLLITCTDDAEIEAIDISLTQVSTDNTCQYCLPGSPTLTGCNNASPTGPLGIIVPISSPTATPSPPSNATGSCTAISSIVPDPCLIGPTWALDLTSTKNLMLQRLASLDPDATVDSLFLYGSGTLEIHHTNAAYQYTDFEVDFNMTVEGIDVPTNTVVNGAMEANLYVQSGGSGSGAFCMDVYEGDGTVVETDLITGGFTLDLGADWIPATLSIQYTCVSGLLTMQGSSSADGNLGWGPYVYTS